MKNLFAVIILALISIAAVSAQTKISPYQPRPYNYDHIKPVKPNFELEAAILQKKQREYNYVQCAEYTNKLYEDCGEVMKAYVVAHTVDLSHSIWLKSASTIRSLKAGFTFVNLKNGKEYYFYAIPETTLDQWKASSSPGSFYDVYIKQYAFPECIY
jgi:hypothetical protein